MVCIELHNNHMGVKKFDISTNKKVLGVFFLHGEIVSKRTKRYKENSEYMGIRICSQSQE